MSTRPTTYWERRRAGEFEQAAAERAAEEAARALEPAPTDVDDRYHVPIGSDLELATYIDEEADGGGGAAAFHGAEIYSGGDIVFIDDPEESTLIQDMTFSSVQLDSDSIADIANDKLVIPAGLDGVWHYGFAFQFSADGEIAVRAMLFVDGSAWNLIAAAVNVGHGALSLASSAIDVFSEGDEIAMQLVADAPVALSPISSGAPQRLFAYYLGPAA